MPGDIANARAARRAARQASQPTDVQRSEHLKGALMRAVEKTRRAVERLNKIMDRAVADGFTKNEILLGMPGPERAEAIQICNALRQIANSHKKPSDATLPDPLG